MIATNLDISEFKNFFQRFTSLISPRVWQHTVKNVRQVIRGNRYAEDFLTEDNSLAFALDDLQGIWERYGQFTMELCRTPSVLFAMAFVTQTISLIDALPRQEGTRLVHRIIGALKNHPDDVRALQLELATATHFLMSGLKVKFPDAAGVERFDLLLSGAGKDDVEIECKFITRDKGKKIHRRNLHEFHKFVVPHIDDYLAKSSSNVVVDIVVKDRFPSAHKDKVAIADSVKAALNGKDNVANGIVSQIKVVDHPLDEIDALSSIESNRGAVERITGTVNENLLIRENRLGRKFALLIRSEQRDTILESIYETLSEASKRQLTTTRPGLLVAMLHGIDIDGLVRIASHEEAQISGTNTLQVIASRLLRQKQHDHLVSIWFLSESEIGEREPGLTSSAGATYYFKNEESPLWGEGYDFRPSPLTKA